MSLFGSYSHVVIMGNMTRDAEIRTLNNGTRVTTITVAVSERIKKGEEWVEEASFIDVDCWEKKAEWVERFGGKGKPILVAGRLRQQKWQDKATGQNRSKLVVVADEMTFIGGKDGGGGGGSGGGQASRGQGNGGQRGSTGGGRGKPAGGMPYAQNVDDMGGDGTSYSDADYEGGYAGASQGAGGPDAPPWVNGQ